jgi:hypothetical protein
VGRSRDEEQEEHLRTALGETVARA